jgi:hypothetical protein
MSDNDDEIKVDEGEFTLSDATDLPLADDDESLLLTDATDDGFDLASVDLGSERTATSIDAAGPEPLSELDLGDLGDLDELAPSAGVVTANPNNSPGLHEISLSDDPELAPEQSFTAPPVEELDFSSHASEPEVTPTSSNVDEPLFKEDLNFEALGFSSEEMSNDQSSADDLSDFALSEVEEDEEEEEIIAPPPSKKKKREEPVQQASSDFREVSSAYTSEMERTQATIANLRADREELLAKIQQMEDERLHHNRSHLTLRAELDERKIELTIIRKKLNEEIGELKDRMRLQEERKLILEEKNKLLLQEVEKANQRSKIDVKKIQLRERELEQRLELLKSDAETQIRHRDLKILELKRKLDAMEFDMESISTQEKKSVESRFELEDKLDKAIKTLRTAITDLENESDRGQALSALKKNIDM